MKWTRSLAKSLEWIFEAEWVTMYCQNKCVVQIQQVISRQHLPGKRFRYQKHRKGLYINLPQGREAWERFTTTHATWLETCISQPRFLGSHVSIKTQKAVLYNQKLTLDPFHPNISIHILHTVLYTFPQVLTRRIFSTIKSFISWLSFILCPWPSFCVGVNLKGEIRS